MFEMKSEVQSASDGHHELFGNQWDGSQHVCIFIPYLTACVFRLSLILFPSRTKATTTRVPYAAFVDDEVNCVTTAVSFRGMLAATGSFTLPVQDRVTWCSQKVNVVPVW